MSKEKLLVARQQIGAYLKSIREEKGISTYHLSTVHGVRFESIKAIEEGSSNYTIDNFLNYITSLDCFFYLENKTGSADQALPELLKHAKPRFK